MRNFVRGVLLLLLLGCSFAGQADEWQKYKNRDGNFAIMFPGEPQDSVNKSDAEIQSHTLMAQEKPAFYTVVYTNMATEQTVDDANYNSFKDAVFKELPKCAVGPEQPASPVVGGYIGHAYSLSCAISNVQLTMAGNLYWGKHHAYAVMAMFPTEIAEPAMVKSFVESFSLIDPAK